MVLYRINREIRCLVTVFDERFDLGNNVAKSRVRGIYCNELDLYPIYSRSLARAFDFIEEKERIETKFVESPNPLHQSVVRCTFLQIPIVIINSWLRCKKERVAISSSLFWRETRIIQPIIYTYCRSPRREAWNVCVR